MTGVTTAWMQEVEQRREQLPSERRQQRSILKGDGDIHMITLNSVRALITRPEPQASPLAQAIIEHQGQAVVMPMIDIIPLPETQALRHTILNLDQYDQVIVTSRPATQWGLMLLEQYWPQLPLHLQWFAIGSSTAKDMLDYGVRSDNAGTGFDSEALLMHPELQSISGHRILIIKGQGGRALLQQELRARGARVDTLAVYQRRRSEYPAHEVVKQLESHRINAILCGSGETVTHLEYYLPELHRLDCLVVVPSERVAQHALALGFQQVHNANGASNHAMLSALAETIQTSPEGPS